MNRTSRDSAPLPPASPAALERPDQVVTFVTQSARDFEVLASGPGWVEVGLGFGRTVFAWPSLWTDAARLAAHLRRSRSGYAPLVLLGDDRSFAEHGLEGLRGEGEISLETLPLGAARLLVILANQRETLRLRRIAAESVIAAERTQFEVDELSAIGRQLSSERNIGRLFDAVLERSRWLTDADAGSIYVVDGEDEDVSRRVLRFKASQNDSRPMDFTEFTLPVSPESIVGRCVLSRSTINIPDLYKIGQLGDDNPWGFVHNRAFDEKSGYQTRSMLAVPMIDAQRQVIGVVQLINRKRRPEARLVTEGDFDEQVIPFSERAENLAATLATQAGICLENALLYDDIRQLFEGFVHASVTAIEQRDPTTSGHSQRVADLTVELARATDREGRGRYRKYYVTHDELKQIEYAALLHDFGKVGVRENVLVKARKLYDADRDLILARFDVIRRELETEAERRKVRALLASHGREDASLTGSLETIDDELAARLGELDEYADLVLRANEPSVLDQGGFERLAEVAGRTYRHRGRGGVTEVRPYLTAAEVETLQILRGSLTVAERQEIESHVTHTYDFLSRIPWGRSFRDIPAYAGSHHEKLDGSGYPRRLAGDAIPVPARMMTISDIYDALTASDRPYKRAVPAEKALDILSGEVKAGKCDAELFRIFVEAKIWQRAHRG
jgi:HD-GYP domain-containing protein (c-di-GMP phosphodiesterase class II)